jgi:hypothetical protein
LVSYLIIIIQRLKTGGFIIISCLFNVVSGSVVIFTIANIESADPKLLLRTALQLVFLSFFEMVAAITYIVLVALPSTIYNSGWMVWGLTTIFPNSLLWALMILLLLQFRITVWQLKEVAIGRNVTLVSASSASARRTAVSYTDDMSKVNFLFLLFGSEYCFQVRINGKGQDISFQRRRRECDREWDHNL